MSNPFNEMENMNAPGADHYTGTLSTATVATVTIATAGWYKISADQDWYWRGPATNATTVSSTTGIHEWFKDTPPPVKAAAGDKIALLAVSTSGTYFVNKTKGQ